MKNPAIATLVVGLILGSVIPLAVLNLPLLRDLGIVDLFAYGLGIIVIVASTVVSLFVYRDGVLGTTLDLLKGELSHLQKSLHGDGRCLSYVVEREQLYETLANFVRNAEERIDLMYQAPQPPLSFRRSSAKVAYLAALDAVVAANKVPVRRIVLLTPENKAWIRDLVGKYRGRQTVSLAVIVDEVHFPIISVQLVDRAKTVLLNLIAGTTGLGPRDVVLDSEEMTRVFEWHYEALFKSCVKLVENGRVDEQAFGRFFS